MCTTSECRRDDVEQEIGALKRSRNAVILAHYYQESQIQDLADFVGDSLQLAQAASRSTAEVIVVCGVHFMAETAKLLNPDRIVLEPDPAAGCSLADGCPVEEFRAWRARHPDAIAVSYINCSAAVKAESDLVCTSSNAVRVVESLPRERTILFAPDRNLGRWVARQTGRDLLLWSGTCIVHETFSLRELVRLRMEHPGAKLVAHPECEEPLLAEAAFVGSTAALLQFVERDPAREYIVATEPGILHQMRRRAPDKVFWPLPGGQGCACNICPHMRLNTPEKLCWALEKLEPRVELEPELAARARLPLDRMLALG